VDKIKNQASKVSELVFAGDTGATYKRAVTLTWDILRETGILLWLVICLVFVGAEWFWKVSIKLGRQSRDWYEGLQEPSHQEPKSATEIGQSALTALTTGTENLVYQAKKQLGIDAEPPAPKPITPKVKPAQTPAPAPTPTPETQTTVGPPAASAPPPAAPTGAEVTTAGDEEE
jgi:hypothetical protein